jgi:streptomycin 6-kinase
MNIEIPSHLARNLKTHHGERVDGWLATIPALLERLEKGWDFTPEACMLGGVASVLLRGTLKDGHVAILKIPFDPQLVLWEAQALEHWQGRGCSPKLIALDKKALLLEYVVGDPVTGSSLVDPVKIVELVKCLHAEPQPKNITVPDLHSVWLERVDILEARLKLRAPGALQEELIKARTLALSLHHSTPKKVLLHGDLHLGNMLIDQTGSLHAIDPKPRYGDPGWDVAYITLSAKLVSEQKQMLSALCKLLDYPLERAQRWQWLLAFDEVISKWWQDKATLKDIEQYDG